MKRKIKVSKDQHNLRLDKFLFLHTEGLSRNQLQKLIEQEAVTVNEKVKSASYKLKVDDVVAFTITKEKPARFEPYPQEVPILYEDDALIIVDKPTGLIVHPHAGHNQNTLVNALLYMGKKLSCVSPHRPGIVHRLDKDTSGIMVVAKNDATHINLVEQFKARTVKKEYLAYVWGTVKKDTLTIDLPVRRDKSRRLTMKISFIGSKNAYTEIKVVERLNKATFLSIKPLTGRMHQIRVHLKFLGYPIVGDKVYGKKDNYDTMYLHSKRIGFFHPVTGKRVEFSTPVPGRFKEFIKENA